MNPLRLPKLNLTAIEKLIDHLAMVYHVNWNHIIYTTKDNVHLITVNEPIVGTGKKVPIANITIRIDGATFASLRDITPLQELGIMALAEKCLVLRN